MLDPLRFQLALYPHQLIIHHGEQLGVTGLNHFSQCLPLQAARRATADTGYFNIVFLADQTTEGATVAHLDRFRVERRRAEGVGDVAGHSAASVRDHLGVAQGTAGKQRHVHGAATDVHHADTQLFLVFGQHRIAGGQRGEDQLIDSQTHFLDTLLDVASHVVMAGDEMHLGRHPYTGETNRILDPFLIVDGKLLRQHVQHPQFIREANRLGGVDHVVHVFLSHLFVGDGYHAGLVAAVDMLAGQAEVNRADLAIRHHLGLFHRTAQ